MLKKLFASTFLIFVYSAQAIAASDGHDSHGSSHHGDAHHGSSGGLPQLDPSSYPSQIFWLVVVFVLMYFFFAKKSLPEISGTIEKRSERITNDLDSAERLKEEVSSVQTSYEDSLKGAREESSALFAQMEKDIKEKSEKLSSDFQDESTKQIRDLEKEIENARKVAMEEMADVAAEVAKDSAAKIIGVEVDLKYAKSVVDSLVDETVKKAA
ncbi:MAG: F0F1 ATP synthase subunit B [Alcanivorax sp.]